MQTPASLAADKFEARLGRLAAALARATLARRTKAIARGRKLGTGAARLRLAPARGPSGLSLRHGLTGAHPLWP